jgi:hypothetical protein
VAHVVECLPGRHEALSLNCNIAKKKNKKRKKEKKKITKSM